MSIMRPENYQQNISIYSEEQLKEMLLSPSLYHDDAMLAAIWEAEKRNIYIPGLESLKAKYEALYEVVIKTDHEKAKAEALGDTEPLPELFSHISIFWFTLLFNTIFGGAMLAYNLNKINKKAQTQVYAFTALYTVLGMLAVSVIQLGALFPFIYNLVGALILRDYFWKRFVPFGMKFRVKSSQTPFLIGLGYSVLLLVALYFFGEMIYPQV